MVGSSPGRFFFLQRFRGKRTNKVVAEWRRGSQRERPGKMAPASLVLLAWLLFTMRMVTAAVHLEPEEEGELTLHITRKVSRVGGDVFIHNVISEQFFISTNYGFNVVLPGP